MTAALQSRREESLGFTCSTTETVADWSQNRKRYTFVARKQKKRAARWERHGWAQKSSERNRKRKKEKSDEAIQKSALERKG